MSLPAPSPRTRPVYRIGLVLSVIALVPLIGAAWFAVGAVVDARAERDRLSVVDEKVQDLVALSELRTRVLDERNWNAALTGIAQLGLPLEVVITLTGIDIAAEFVEASTSVDRLIAELELPEVAQQIRTARNTDGLTLTEAGDRYLAIEGETAATADALLDEVLLEATAVGDNGALVSGLRVLESTHAARQAISSEFNHYFGAQFSDAVDRADEIVDLVAEATVQTRALAETARMARDGSHTREVLERILASPDIAAYNAAVDTLVADTLAGSGEDAALTAVLGDLDGVAQTFEAASVSTDAFFELVSAAGDDVAEASHSAAADADRRNRRALGTLLALAAASVLIALAATRVIAQPLRRLSAAARRIRDGESHGELVTERGPAEIRDAARAINEATDHLILAERQALALAEGDLEHESLRETGSGALGASLQNAVQTLAASLMEREEFRRRMTHEATHDGLTQLPNRNASLGQLQRGLARTERADAMLAVLFIDLDGFKEVNDHHGHHAGDLVLRAAAQRLSATARAGDHVGRLGGDEFLVIAEPVADLAEALDLADRLHSALTAPIHVDTTTVFIDASIGIALSSHGPGDAATLLRDADLAVYKAKGNGRGRVEVCDDELRSAMAERAELEESLREALVNDEFVLHYQPIVESRSEVVVGYEALVRWNRPGYGMVAPDGFIPFAERSELIIGIDRWVLRSVSRQIVAWEAGHLVNDMAVSINISGRHLAVPEFVANILGPIDELGIDPRRIIIEITESALLDDLTSAAFKLQQLRQRGIRTAIDDFGTGYTSLAHLKSLPVDILKIDRSFTADAAAASLVQLIIDTGHLLGASVTAEGIETRVQADLLRAMGTDDVQGFLFGRPLPASELFQQIGTAVNTSPPPSA